MSKRNRTNSLPITAGLNVVITKGGLKILVDTTDAEKAAMKATGQSGPRFEIPVDDLDYLRDHLHAFVGASYPNQSGTHTYEASKDGSRVKIGFVVGKTTYDRVYSTEVLQGAMIGVEFAEMVAENAAKSASRAGADAATAKAKPVVVIDAATAAPTAPTPAPEPAPADEFADGQTTEPNGLPPIAEEAASSTVASAEVDPPALEPPTPDEVVAPPVVEVAPPPRSDMTLDDLTDLICSIGKGKPGRDDAERKTKTLLRAILTGPGIGHTIGKNGKAPIPGRVVDLVLAKLAASTKRAPTAQK